MIRARIFVDRADEQPDLDRQQLDVREVDLDVARDHEALVEHSVQNVDQSMRTRGLNELGHLGLEDSRARGLEDSKQQTVMSGDQ